MTEFDPERFEEEKYRDHFTQLQQAYKAAFGRMREDLGYDSTLVHAVDQFVLNESEPFWDAERETFRVDVPEEPTPAQRVENAGVVVDEAKLDAMLADYRTTLAEELEYTFGLAERPPEDETGVPEENA
jgi:hypothetical protein